MFFNKPSTTNLAVINSLHRVKFNYKFMLKRFKRDEPASAVQAIKELERELKALRKYLKDPDAILNTTEFKQKSADTYYVHSELGVWSAIAHFAMSKGARMHLVSAIAEGNSPFFENCVLSYPAQIQVLDCVSESTYRAIPCEDRAHES